MVIEILAFKLHIFRSVYETKIKFFGEANHLQNVVICFQYQGQQERDRQENIMTHCKQLLFL